MIPDDVRPELWTAITDAVDATRRALRSAPGRPVLVAFHGDADGVCAARCLEVAISAAGAAVHALAPHKGEHAHTPLFLARLSELAGRAGGDAALLVVADMGSRPAPLLPETPAVLIDHHRPAGFPPGAAVVSSAPAETPEPASLLAFLFGEALSPGSLEDLDWVAAAGTVGDLGPRAPFALLGRAFARHTKGAVTETAALLNAAGRAPQNDLQTALEALRESPAARDLVKGLGPAARRLQAYRAAVQAEVQRWARSAPVVSGEVALIPIASPARIHSLLATRWTTRLAPRVVIVANGGYRPGWVHFAARCAVPRDLLAFLAPARDAVDEGDVGYGHTRASGGVVTSDAFGALLDHWGFRPEVAARLVA